MKNVFSVVCLLVCFFVSVNAATQESDSYKPNVLAARLMLGGATALIDGGVGDLEADDPKPRLAGGTEFAVNHYFSRTVALNFGFGIMGKGYRAESSSPFGDITVRMAFLNMEIPFGVLFNLSGFRLGLDVVTSIVLSGKVDYSWGDESGSDTVEDWDGVRRVNILPRVTMGFAIPAGSLFIVPAVLWEMDMLNFHQDDELSEEAREMINEDRTYRHMNIMFSLGLEWGV
ncbi:MAG: hypothetical protein JXR76_30655 [Deltaproteobacteria bacterium]|nr:hypothetical protein [Deltaproteobacteria bacterium]